MNDLVQGKMKELAELCRQHRVRRLALFGSAVGDNFDPNHSDLDILVEFQPMSPGKGEHADSYFGLLQALERLFAVPIDLVEAEAIRNPYFQQAVESTQVVLFDAA